MVLFFYMHIYCNFLYFYNYVNTGSKMTEEKRNDFNFNISYSAMSCFEECQRSFYYAKIEKAEQDNQDRKYADFGSALHDFFQEEGGPQNS